MVDQGVFLRLRVSDRELEIFEAKFLIKVKKSLTQVEADRVLLILERRVQVELEAFVEELVRLLRKLIIAKAF